MLWIVAFSVSAALASGHGVAPPASGVDDGGASPQRTIQRNLQEASGAPLSMFAPEARGDDSQRVLDGETRSEIDSIALITFEKSGKPMRCTGVVVDSFTVLSAAHCANGGSDFVIHINGDAWMSTALGPNSAPWGGERQKILPKTVAIHKNYSVNGISDDMVVFVLEERVSSAYIPQLPLVATQKYIDSLTDEDTVHLCGFGQQEDGTVAHLLQCVQVAFKSIEDDRRCRQHGKDVICVASENGKTTCFGDSGGPLYHKPKGTNQFVVLGVLGDGIYPPGASSDDCSADLASRYCSVGPKLDWVRTYSKAFVTVDSPEDSSIIKRKKEKETAQIDGAVGIHTSASLALAAFSAAWASVNACGR